MSKLLTVLHVFYHEQVDYFIDKLMNINGIDWDLVVTYSSYSAETEAKLKDFKPDVKMVQVGNAGYDVWPFIQVIQNVDFSEYDYVLKLHTKGQSKQRLNGLNFKEWLWRDLLVNAILRSRSRFTSCIKLLDEQKEIGMLCSYELFKDMEGVLPEESDMLQEEAERISLDVADGFFCAGTMFLARLDAFRRLKDVEFTDELWGTLNKSHGNGTLAHVYERIFSLMVVDEGYEIQVMLGSKKSSSSVFFKRNVSPVFKSIFNLDRDPKTYDKYLTLLGVKMKLEDGGLVGSNPINILLANNHLQKTGGTENYTYALSLELKKQGHNVEYFAFERGEVSDLMEAAGIPYMSRTKYDLILANHTTTVEHLHTYGYIIQTCHGVAPALEQPSRYADEHVSVTQEVKEHVASAGYDSKVIHNGIDCERFAPLRPINDKLTSVLSLCQSDEINDFIGDCCKAIGVKFHACNKHTDNVWKIEELINQADLVVGIGRSLYDAMACGRCVISFDNRGYMSEALGDGYLTSENFFESIKRNCSGRELRRKFTQEEFIEELKKYNPEDGEWARKCALENLNISKAAETYLNLYLEYLKKKELRLVYKIKKIRRSASLMWKRYKESRRK